MFYYLLLNQFVCIHKLGKITEIDLIVATKKRCELSISTMIFLGGEALEDSGPLFVTRILAFRPST
jgi:hypothetical protein